MHGNSRYPATRGESRYCWPFGASGSGPGPIDRQMRRRLELLFTADMSLAAYHLPLDAHPEIGITVASANV